MVLPAAAAGVILSGFQARGGPLDTGIRARKGATAGEFAEIFQKVEELAARGREPLLFTDPFTGGLTLGTVDQEPFLFDILGERFAREELATTPAESQAIFEARERFIESRRVNPVFPGTVAPVAAQPVDAVREQVIQSLVATSPKVVAPGVVSGRTAKSTRPGTRLGGPCAGVTTGFQRLACGRGGFT